MQHVLLGVGIRHMDPTSSGPLKRFSARATSLVMMPNIHNARAPRDMVK